MDKGNETAFRQCRFLNEGYFDQLYSAFSLAFSDYVIPFALTEQQFRNHLNLTAVDLKRTVACVKDERIVGFSLNGFGIWDGKRTAYDAGTGVIPGHRRQGISEEMFRVMLPEFERAGVEQILLEVITTNTNAIKLYEKLGFRAGRLLALLQRDEPLEVKADPQDIQLRPIEKLDWAVLSSFWDSSPAWQNSSAAIERSTKLKRVVGAFTGERCLGYVIFSEKFGRIAQLAVDRDFRRRGIGTALLGAVQGQTVEGYSLQVINIDTTLKDAMAFFEEHGFYQRLNQHEMIKTL
jgi:ribosomal protein S18 acetylase RimI-like enzyme